MNLEPTRQPTTAERLPPSSLIPFRPSGDPRPNLRLVSNAQPDTTDKATKLPPVLAAVHKVFKTTGADRLHTTRLLANPALNGMSAKQLGTLLAACGVQPMRQPFIADGQRGRGYQYADIAAAVQRITDGRIKPANHAHDWSAPTTEEEED